jgi:hypothetical protein
LGADSKLFFTEPAAEFSRHCSQLRESFEIIKVFIFNDFAAWAGSLFDVQRRHVGFDEGGGLDETFGMFHGGFSFTLLRPPKREDVRADHQNSFG